MLETGDRALHSERIQLDRPVVIRLVTYVRIPRDVHRRKITRKAVLARDAWTCQYCGSERSGLTVDHVIPRSRGGESVWENIVASCAPCNRRKGNRLPREIHDAPEDGAAPTRPERLHPRRGTEAAADLGALPGPRRSSRLTRFVSDYGHSRCRARRRRTCHCASASPPPSRSRRQGRRRRRGRSDTARSGPSPQRGRGDALRLPLPRDPEDCRAVDDVLVGAAPAAAGVDDDRRALALPRRLQLRAHRDRIRDLRDPAPGARLGDVEATVPARGRGCRTSGRGRCARRLRRGPGDQECEQADENDDADAPLAFVSAFSVSCSSSQTRPGGESSSGAGAEREAAHSAWLERPLRCGAERGDDLRSDGTSSDPAVPAGARVVFAGRPACRLAARHLQSPNVQVTQFRTTSFLWSAD